MKTKVLVLLVFLSGCATTNFDPTKPITDGETSYKQNGENIDRGDLIKKLKDNPKTKDDAQVVESLEKVSMAFGVGSGLLLGLGVALPSAQKATSSSSAKSGLSDSDRSGLLIGGGVFLLGEIIVGLISSKRLANAVSTHNSGLQISSSTNTNITPYVQYLASGGTFGLKIGL